MKEKINNSLGVASFIEARFHPALTMSEQERKALYGETLLKLHGTRKMVSRAIYGVGLICFLWHLAILLDAGVGLYLSSSAWCWRGLFGLWWIPFGCLIVGSQMNYHLAKKEALLEWQRLRQTGVIDDKGRIIKDDGDGDDGGKKKRRRH